MKKYRKIYIEITNQCNLSCSFCPKTGRSARRMTPDEFKSVIMQLKDRGESFYLHVMGEPTSHPDFGEILRICKENDIKVCITTNGTLLDKTGDTILSESVKMVSVSLHSFEANKISDMKAYLDKVMDFCKKADESNTTVELRLWNFDRECVYDKNQLNGQILDYLQENLTPDFRLDDAVDNMLSEIENSNRRKFNLKIRNRIFLGMAEHFEWPDISKTTKCDTGFCYGLRNQIAVLSNGDVVPCCLDSEGNMVLGNIFTQNIDDIISSDRRRAIYNGFTERKAVEPLCQTCGYMLQHLKIENK